MDTSEEIGNTPPGGMNVNGEATRAGQGMTLHALARHIGPNHKGKLLSVAALARWRTRGCLSVGGRLVKLRGLKIGGTLRVTLQDYEAFIAELNDPAPPESTPAPEPVEAAARAKGPSRGREKAKAVAKAAGF